MILAALGPRAELAAGPPVLWTAHGRNLTTQCSSRLCRGLRGRAAYRRRRRRSLRDRGRNPNAVGEGPVIIADCVRRRRRGALREQTDRQRGLPPSSAARLRQTPDAPAGVLTETNHVLPDYTGTRSDPIPLHHCIAL